MVVPNRGAHRLMIVVQQKISAVEPHIDNFHDQSIFSREINTATINATFPIRRRPTQINTLQSMDNSFIKKLKASGRSLVVFYGSQTGTAEEFAGRLAKEGIRYQLKGMVADPEECDMVSNDTFCPNKKKLIFAPLQMVVIRVTFCRKSCCN